MHNRSFIIKIEKIKIVSFQHYLLINEYLETCICFITKKILINNNYNTLDIRYNCNTHSVNNAFSIVDNTHINPAELQKLISLSDIINKYIEQVIEEFYIYNLKCKATMNINSMLINTDSLLLTFDIFPDLDIRRHF